MRKVADPSPRPSGLRRRRRAWQEGHDRSALRCAARRRRRSFLPHSLRFGRLLGLIIIYRGVKSVFYLPLELSRRSDGEWVMRPVPAAGGETAALTCLAPSRKEPSPAQLMLSEGRALQQCALSTGNAPCPRTRDAVGPGPLPGGRNRTSGACSVRSSRAQAWGVAALSAPSTRPGL